jgi:hypothetical protein
MLPTLAHDAGGVEATKRAFLGAVERGVNNQADHYFLWLWDNIPAVEALDLLLTVAIPKNVQDDHYFIFPSFTWRAAEWLGQEYLPILMRPAVRYVTRFPTPPAIPEFEGLLDEYQLLTRSLRQDTGTDETPAIGHLGESIGQCNTYAEIPEMLAKALADGLSLEGAGEALSIGAASLFLRSLTGNPMDVHLHTGVNLRRYLLQLDGLSLRNKLLALLMWHTGPEVRSTQRRMEPLPQPDPAAVATLPYRTQDELLDAMTESVYHQPPIDWSTVANLGQLRAVPEVKVTVNLPSNMSTLATTQPPSLRVWPRLHATITLLRCMPSSTIKQSSRSSMRPVSHGAGAISLRGPKRQRFPSAKIWNLRGSDRTPARLACNPSCPPGAAASMLAPGFCP